jgi:hypothetical protein
MKTTIKKRKFEGVVYFNDMFDNPHKRKITLMGKNPREVYAKLKSENGVFDIENFREITIHKAVKRVGRITK